MSDRTTFEARCPCGGSVKFEGGSNGAARVRDNWHEAHNCCAEVARQVPRLVPSCWPAGTEVDAGDWTITNVVATNVVAHAGDSSVVFGPGCNS